MALIIRIPLEVQQLNALAGYYTDGPSLAAGYGLASSIAREANIPLSGFGFVVERYESRLTEYILPGQSAAFSAADASQNRSVTGYRYGDAKLALYLETDEVPDYDLEPILEAVADAVNGLRFQGGVLTQLVSAGAGEGLRLSSRVVDSDYDLADMLGEEAPLAQAYLKNGAALDAQGNRSLVERYADVLAGDDWAILLCSGYVQVGVVDGQRIVEPTYTVGRLQPCYLLRKDDSCPMGLYDNFFWRFDAALNALSTPYFCVS